MKILPTQPPPEGISLVYANQVKKNAKLFGLTALSAFFIGASIMSSPAVARDKLNYKCDSACIENGVAPDAPGKSLSRTLTFSNPHNQPTGPAVTPPPGGGGGGWPPNTDKIYKVNRAVSFYPYNPDLYFRWWPYLGGAIRHDVGGGFNKDYGNGVYLNDGTAWAYDKGLLRTPYQGITQTEMEKRPGFVGYYVPVNPAPPNNGFIDKSRFQLFYTVISGLYTNSQAVLSSVSCNDPGYSPATCLTEASKQIEIEPPTQPAVFTLSGGPPPPYDRTPLSYKIESVPNKGQDLAKLDSWTHIIDSTGYYQDPTLSMYDTFLLQNHNQPGVTLDDADSILPPELEGTAAGDKLTPSTYYALRNKINVGVNTVDWFLPADDGSESGKGWFVTCAKGRTPEIISNGFATYETAPIWCMRDAATEGFLTHLTP